MKIYIKNEEVIPAIEEGKTIFVDLPEGTTLDIKNTNEAKTCLNSYLQVLDFYYKDETTEHADRIDEDGYIEVKSGNLYLPEGE